MATNFPGSLDSFTNPSSSSTLDSPSHAAQHSNVNDAVEALQAKVGVDGSAVTSSLDYQLGLVRIANATFTNVASFDVTGFSADFNVYKLTLSYNSHIAVVASVTAQIRLAGSPYGSSYYGSSWYASYLGGSGIFGARNNGGNIILPQCASYPPSLLDVTIRGPSTNTFAMTYIAFDTGNTYMVTGGFSNYSTPNNFDTIRITGSVNLTGSWQLSGVRT